ncbi:Uma2 family endonuclease [Streptosporangium becharense]|uniref:Uma2 family endonuclease n=1 Tax=Streptosporangium becharense TaxID=1816182 RepID=A0A7W9ID16_9ACTN|nr:Uma2 family endonuclease [Streptosporangium becharense]MBB2912954.1 Uma2 family endonuclease [Streptosporangium becharense]MBB5818221.1 Uma2 family endonuclease [Streptosporangium becharense]
MTAALPEWFHLGPEGGWTADMLDRLPPDAPPHVELIDGSLITRSPQTAVHMLMLRLLERALTPPDNLIVVREMSVTLGIRQRPEPDIMVVTRSALTSLKTTSFKPEDVRLVVEVVSPESVERDRSTKPIKYSDAGIKHLWRVEQEDDRPVVYTFELEPSVRAYVPTGIHRGRLRTDIGFEVDIELDLEKFIGP